MGINTFGQTVKESGLTEVVQFDVMPLQADRSLRLEVYVVPEISHITNEHAEVVKRTIILICVICGFQMFAKLRKSSK